MSKSVGNVIAPQEIIDKFGAEILRLWVSSVDYREDIRISEEIINRLVDAYRRIRNTCRYLLGNIGDIQLEDLVPLEAMDPLDRYALDVTARAHQRVQEAYVNSEFHKMYHTLHNLCAADLSAFYLDILKDRLYSSGKNDHGRRSAQTALIHILLMLVRDMAPVLSFTADEVYSYLPEALKQGIPSVFSLQALDIKTYLLDEASLGIWQTVLAVRAELTKAIEPLRREGTIGHGLDTHVTLYADAALEASLRSVTTDLRAMCIVSRLDIEPLANAPAEAWKGDMEGLAILVVKAQGIKCERCWIYTESAGTDPEHPGLCPRCTEVLRNNTAVE